MNVKSRSAEVARRAIQRACLAGPIDPDIVPHFFAEAIRLAPPDAILDVAEEAVQDAYWELAVIHSVTRRN
jgi:hypothetical protein